MEKNLVSMRIRCALMCQKRAETSGMTFRAAELRQLKYSHPKRVLRVTPVVNLALQGPIFVQYFILEKILKYRYKNGEVKNLFLQIIPPWSETWESRCQLPNSSRPAIKNGLVWVPSTTNILLSY